MTDYESAARFQNRLQNIARASGFRIKPSALISIAADVAAELETDAASSAIARELRALRQSKPLCFEAREDSEP